ncbi:MAG: alpha/beta hydrolase [Bacteroidales bacterium]|nr:alpha/beta hydrolase [Candidatus Liminaster caballi]
MKRIFLSLIALALVSSANAQVNFGGQQIEVSDIHCSQKFADIDYVGDGEVYHTLDIYLPEKKAEKYPVMIHIYGSAWFNNNGKASADIGTICKAYLEAGYAVVCPNHRASTDAHWPAQSHDIKAVIRFIRGNAATYGFDTDFIGTSGFSSGAHLASFMAATSGTRVTSVGKQSIDVEGSLGAYTAFRSDVQVCVSWSGPIDLEHMDCGPGMKMPVSPEEVILGCPLNDENRDRYASLSPLWYLDKDDPAIIIFHGTADNVVPYCQGEIWAEAVKAASIRTEFVTQPEGGHGYNMYSPANLAKATAFINEALAKTRK